RRRLVLRCRTRFAFVRHRSVRDDVGCARVALVATSETLSRALLGLRARVLRAGQSLRGLRRKIFFVDRPAPQGSLSKTPTLGRRRRLRRADAIARQNPSPPRTSPANVTGGSSATTIAADGANER